MEIKVRDESLGECTIVTNDDVSKEVEYIIKALCVNQIMCMNSKEDPTKFKKFIKILRKASQEIEDLYADEKEEDHEYRIQDQFDI